MEKQPAMGQIVIYKHRGSADGVFPILLSPAIIQAVRVDDNEEVVCDLFVMSNTGGIFFAKDVKHGDSPGEWEWPEIK